MVLVRRLIMVEPLVPMDLQVIRRQAILWELIRLFHDSAVASAEALALVEAVALAEALVLTAGEVVAGDSGGKLKVTS